MAIKQVLKKPECHCIEKIILVGGFTESTLLFEEVEKEFSPAISSEKELSSFTFCTKRCNYIWEKSKYDQI